MLDIHGYRELSDAEKVTALTYWMDVLREVYVRACEERERYLAERDEARAQVTGLRDALERAQLEADARRAPLAPGLRAEGGER